MAGTTVWVTKEMLERIREKASERAIKAFHPGLVASFATELWVKGEWTPGPDTDGLKDERLYLQLEDRAYIAALKKRQAEGVQISPIYRRALQDWVDGKWDIGLVVRAT